LCNCFIVFLKFFIEGVRFIPCLYSSVCFLTHTLFCTMFVDTPAHNSDRVVRGVPSDLVSLNSINTAGAASVMGMFNTSALYNDALLDNNVYGNSGGGGGSSNRSSALNYSGAGSSMLLPPGASAGAAGVGGRTGAAAGGGGGGGGRSSYAFDTASLKSQDDTIRYKPVLHFRSHLYF
jgi:hypothetical protein